MMQAVLHWQRPPEGLFSIVPITKRPCANCPFRADGAAISLQPGRLDEIVQDLLRDDHETFVCHKTLDKDRMTCMGAMVVMHKIGRLPVLARLGLVTGAISIADLAEIGRASCRERV